jgi:GNAT superfamily N-acetyltransferase
MRYQRLRIQLDNNPGRLGEVAAALGRIGVNILDLEVHSVASGSCVDEVIADFRAPVDFTAVERAVRDAGGVLVDVAPVDAHELRDRATTALQLATSLVEPGVGQSERISEAARQLVGAELAWGMDGQEPGDTLEVVRRVLDTRSPVQVDAPVKLLPNAGTRTWWLGLPVETDGADLAVLVLVRRGARFTFTETARVQALLRLHGAACRRRHHDAERLHDGGIVTVRELEPSDFGAVMRLHSRCSAVSLYRRYFSPLPNAPEKIVRQLVDVDGSSRIGFVAALGSEVVGVAHAFRSRADDFELAFLVEDGHQCRGIGSLLFGRLSRRLVDLGVYEAHALTLPDNQGIRRLMTRAAERSSVWEEGMLRIDARLIGAPTRTEAASSNV